MDFRPIATGLTVAALALAGCGGDEPAGEAAAAPSMEAKVEVVQ